MTVHGFVDLHTHGIGRYDTRTEDPEDIIKMAELHGNAGTAAFLPTIYSGTIQRMRKNMGAVRKAMEIQKAEGRRQKANPPSPPFTKGGKGGIYNSSLILGVHLEGPFLNPLRCGALDKNSFIKSTLSNLKKLIEGYEDIVKIITIAPELPGALRVIERCVSLGIKVNMGHSDATYREALDGKQAGARGITHIFNAMRPFHHREPGLIGLGLLDKDIYIEVIADSIHINPITLRLIFKIKPPDRIIPVSDSIRGAKIRKGLISRKAGILAGSYITLLDAVKNIKSIGILEADIIEVSINNPQRYLST